MPMLWSFLFDSLSVRRRSDHVTAPPGKYSRNTADCGGFQSGRGAKRPVAVKRSSSRTRSNEGIRYCAFEPSYYPIPSLSFLIQFWERPHQYHRQDSRPRQEEAHLRSRPQQW
ncbi:hypothetical protein OJAV_G00062140 [Oryzias javanicus]|uniref:Uncharacterized protein n=1 Tax=Oryzias javanicus TaxID=123683 RepID=A0A3S2M8T1_ORYJA|nr:hypothetical protein OJAV_G00062140 [Oryzias javanicus]